MIKNNYINRLKELPETTKQFGGLFILTIIIILSFGILNIYWGGGDELIKKKSDIWLSFSTRIDGNIFF